MRPMISALILLLGTVVVPAGCALEDRTIHSGDYTCENDGDCAWGWKCVAQGTGQKRCVAPATAKLDGAVAPDGSAHDAGPPTPDAFLPPDGWPAACGAQAPAQVTVKRHKAGDFSLAFDPALAYQAVTIPNPPAKAAAVTLDYSAGWQQFAGFVVSVATKQTDPREAALEAIARAKKVSKMSSFAAVSSGDAIRTHDRFDAQVGQSWLISGGGATTVGALRHELIAAFLGFDAAHLDGLPPGVGQSGDSFTLALASVLRVDGRVILIGAVVPEAEGRDPLKRTQALLQGISGGTWLALHDARLDGVARCDVEKLTTAPQTKLDIIAVMDETGSMTNTRRELAKESVRLLQYAEQYGFDYRLGITGVTNPSGNFAAVGRFCSVASTSSSHPGGTDRFLLPSERDTIAACLYNPPGHEGGAEYGLTNIKAAVTSHLPRAKSDPAKIRSDARVLVVVATDERAIEISDIVDYKLSQTCPLPLSIQTALDARVNTGYVDPLSGKQQAEAKVDRVFVMGGVCNTTVDPCVSDVAYGYNELVKGLGGKVVDVCEGNLAEKLRLDLRELLLGQVSFDAPPVASSLAVSVDGKLLRRDTSNQFHHDPKHNTLRIHAKVPITKGSTIIASYHVWK